MPDPSSNPAPDIAVTPVMKRSGHVVMVAAAVENAVGTERLAELVLTHEGIPGDRHAGFLRPADVRVPWFERHAPIQNERQLSIVSMEDLAVIAGNLGIERVEPEWLGANIAVEGVPDFSFLPRGTRLFFPSGAVLAVMGQNDPCRIAGAEVERHLGGQGGLALRFAAAAKRLRGVVAIVDRPGSIRGGEGFKLRIPEQWIWQG
ncbi:molybdenum cofactor sulfurase [Labrys sp. LIt4]|uniref:MOSC domain-containing protein n=1 Tax=Labrys sp. LIt4 TaxID=2821355 RepID=UPI001ADFEB33|nr:molybdenum cofactor sulfurase [Labrys sp. LIt4]MBP0579313.1 molybdenum cofactor sulfurase [Labrys sp. LIt4]